MYVTINNVIVENPGRALSWSYTVDVRYQMPPSIFSPQRFESLNMQFN